MSRELSAVFSKEGGRGQRTEQALNIVIKKISSVIKKILGKSIANNQTKRNRQTHKNYKENQVQRIQAENSTPPAAAQISFQGSRLQNPASQNKKLERHNRKGTILNSKRNQLI